MGGQQSRKSRIRIIFQSKVDRSDLRTPQKCQSKVGNKLFQKSQKVGCKKRIFEYLCHRHSQSQVFITIKYFTIAVTLNDPLLSIFHYQNRKINCVQGYRSGMHWGSGTHGRRRQTFLKIGALRTSQNGILLKIRVKKCS